MLTSIMDIFKSLTKPISDHEMEKIPYPNPTKFIEDALFCSSPLALSYTDPDQKWIIRQHLISLFQDFPSLKPSVGVFTHNDGTTVKLLNANGELPVTRPAPPVPVTIWVHELYPQMAPMVYVDTGRPVFENHPFSDSSGSTTCTYLNSWQFSRCDLSGLARNLIKLFSHNHPFYCHSGYSPGGLFTHPSTASRTEAMDRLAAEIRRDAAAIAAETAEEIENLSEFQVELQERAENLKIMMNRLEKERELLKGRTKQVCDESDRALNWLRVYGDRGCGLAAAAIDDVFEGVDRESEIMIECAAADSAVEDVMYALKKAVEEGALGFEGYMKQVRALAREQFMLRATIVMIENQNDDVIGTHPSDEQSLTSNLCEMLN